MSEINKRILSLIKQNYSANEISDIIGITNKQLFYRLSQIKNNGFDFNKKYYSNGEIEYNFIKDISKDNINNIIYTPNNTNSLTVLFISDLHLSSIYENVDVLNEIYNYCIKKNIHIIINTGDVNNCVGYLKNKKPYTSNNLKQIEHMLKVYPYDRNILNFILFGNHDYSMLIDDGINIETILSNKRHDLISLGYGFAKLNIKKDNIILRHKLSVNDSDKSMDKNIIFEGHHHNSKLINHITNKSLIISVPTISDLVFDDAVLPNQVLEVTFLFNNGLIRGLNMKQLYIKDKIFTLNETYLNQFDNGKNANLMNYEDEYVYKKKRTI